MGAEEDRLRLMAHFKQATLGPAVGSRPQVSNVAGSSHSSTRRGSTLADQAEFDAWARLENMDQDTAKRMFCALLDQHKPGWRQEEESQLPRTATDKDNEPAWKKEAREAGWIPREEAEMEAWTDPARDIDAASSIAASSVARGSNKGKGKRKSQAQADMPRPSFF